MSQPDETTVDVSAVQAVVNHLSALSASLNQLSGQLQDAGNLSWTGGDKDGLALYEQLAPADQAGVQAVKDAKQAVDGLVDSLSATVGLWGNTEGVNVELNQ